MRRLPALNVSVLTFADWDSITKEDLEFSVGRYVEVLHMSI
jgi:hypothetical protein